MSTEKCNLEITFYPYQKIKVNRFTLFGELLEQIPPNIESSGRGTIVKKPSLPVGINKEGG